MCLVDDHEINREVATEDVGKEVHPFLREDEDQPGPAGARGIELRPERERSNFHSLFALEEVQEVRLDFGN